MASCLLTHLLARGRGCLCCYSLRVHAEILSHYGQQHWWTSTIAIGGHRHYGQQHRFTGAFLLQTVDTAPPPLPHCCHYTSGHTASPFGLFSVHLPCHRLLTLHLLLCHTVLTTCPSLTNFHHCAPPLKLTSLCLYSLSYPLVLLLSLCLLP